jgi:DNA-binding IclR family transcriptional regulator
VPARRGDSGKLLAALSVSGPAFRVTPEKVPEIGKALMQAARISRMSLDIGPKHWSWCEE